MGSSLLSATIYLVLMIACAFVLTKWLKGKKKTSVIDHQARIVSKINLGYREKIVVVEIHKMRLVLGVTAQSVQLLDKQPILEANTETQNAPGRYLDPDSSFGSWLRSMQNRF